MEEDYYTPGQAAKILRRSDRHIRRMLDTGELEGEKDPETGRWRIPRRVVHDLLEDRPPRTPASLEAPEASEELQELRARVEDLQ